MAAPGVAAAVAAGVPDALESVAAAPIATPLPPITSAATVANRCSGTLPGGDARNHWLRQMSSAIVQVNRTTSGAPASICIVATAAAGTMCFLPAWVARSTLRTTQGIQPRAAILFGQIRQCRASPLKA